MSRSKRIKYIIQGLLMLLCVAILQIDYNIGVDIIIIIWAVYMAIYAVNQLLYYITLARYMVGGMRVLFKALLVLNIVIEIWLLSDIPKVYIMIYLAAGLAFGGLVDVLRAMETRKLQGVGWKIKLTQGCITIMMAVISLFYVNSARMIVYFFSFGLISSAITKITEAFRKTAVVYIR